MVENQIDLQRVERRLVRFHVDRIHVGLAHLNDLRKQLSDDFSVETFFRDLVYLKIDNLSNRSALSTPESQSFSSLCVFIAGTNENAYLLSLSVSKLHSLDDKVAALEMSLRIACRYGYCSSTYNCQLYHKCN
jgi:hypothetical protein